jgi:hypothetical protein
MAHKPKPSGNALTATLVGMLMIAAFAIVGESIQLAARVDQLAASEAHANSLQAKLDWFKAELHERPPVDLPAAEAVIDENDE